MNHSLNNSAELIILIAEDDEINRTVASKILTAQGHKVICVKNGLEAYESFINSKIDCILMDIEMPVLDGLKSIQRIREYERQNGGHIPIIAVTNYTDKESRHNYFKSGIDDYLSKPFKPFELSLVLQKVIDTVKNN
ncbi:MAG TPA: response regulator [Bacteroidales bacterium]|nr:response regulator [Bacteroidales bacterium]